MTRAQKVRKPAFGNILRMPKSFVNRSFSIKTSLDSNWSRRTPATSARKCRHSAAFFLKKKRSRKKTAPSPAKPSGAFRKEYRELLAQVDRDSGTRDKRTTKEAKKRKIREDFNTISTNSCGLYTADRQHLGTLLKHARTLKQSPFGKK